MELMHILPGNRLYIALWRLRKIIEIAKAINPERGEKDTKEGNRKKEEKSISPDFRYLWCHDHSVSTLLIQIQTFEPIRTL